MAKYKSKAVVIGQPAEAAFERLSDFSAYQARLDELPEDVRKSVGDVRFTADKIVITAPPVGDMTFEVVERVAPSHVSLRAVGAPVPMTLALDLTPEGESATSVVSTIDVDIPVVLRPLVGGKMQDAADKFADLIGTFFRGNEQQA